ncbi:hypothetical protein GCM10007857_24440 [Bradyrhizobium iriomotense]|uniref:Uncharacterized protein n=1 Tax=Bradyrhizobium iriomotense TaxID=441950 RepID=A0ABQ6B0N8_9BRAD|nr:hypothetical protein GCM10007857_24440 [Bradyrhizobium iriomotense]
MLGERVGWGFSPPRALHCGGTLSPTLSRKRERGRTCIVADTARHERVTPGNDRSIRLETTS